MQNRSILSRIKKKPTLADVAKLAGVSLGSASRALSVPDQVKPSTLERVNQAVMQLGYIRNGAAQALASRKTKTIAAIYPTLNNPIFAHSTHSMQQTLWERGYQLLIASHEYHIEDELSIVRSILERGVDGLIMVGTDHDQALFSLLHHSSLPYVLTWSVDESSYPYCVGISNFDAAYDLGQHVIRNGHTQIGLCGGSTLNNERSRGRRNGILAAVSDAGLQVPNEWIFESSFSYEGGRQAIDYFYSLPTRPSVILFGTDLQAIGAMHRCHQLGIRIPEDLSITGFDGMEEASMMTPNLTTVGIPAHEIGHQAALVMTQLLGDTAKNTEQTVIKHQLIFGKSLLKR